MKQKFGHKSRASALSGIAKYQQENHSNLITSITDPNQYFSKLSTLMINFLKENNLKVYDNGRHTSRENNANEVQNNWKLFKLWLTKQ